MLRLALFQPDIPQNTGTLLRLCACLGVEAHLIEPAGFPVTDRAFQRAGMDYLDFAALTRHLSWEVFYEVFQKWREEEGIRLILLTTQGEKPYTRMQFRSGDVVMVGRESAGVPETVHRLVEARVVIPMAPPARSLNVAVAAAMVVGEALRQIGTA